MPTPSAPSSARPIRLAIWYGKGGVGKSTTTMLLSLLAASKGQRVLAVDLDPECGTSRDFLGPQLRHVQTNLRTFLDSPLPEPPPTIPSGIANLDIVPGVPDDQRFFRFFPEHSTKLRDGLDLLPPTYRWIVMDVPNQYDNIAQLGLIAADYLILPVELTADCAERVETAVRTIAEARSSNPGLKVLGALPLASAPRSGRPLGLTAKEALVHRQYAEAFAPHGIRLFHTIMFRSATTVEEARSNADERFLHWTAQRRFRDLLAELHARIKTFATLRSPSHHGHTAKPSRTPATAHR
jgi:cellulose biosynthesis protein BcsQ